MLLIGTKGGAAIDVKAWIQVMLSHHHNKSRTLHMMAQLSLTDIREEHTVLGSSSDASILREIYVRVMLDHDGVLRSNCSTYHFQIVGEGERERCHGIIEHYGWIKGLADHRDQ